MSMMVQPVHAIYLNVLVISMLLWMEALTTQITVVKLPSLVLKEQLWVSTGIKLDMPYPL